MNIIRKLFTVQDAATYLSCHPMTIRKMMAKRQIPYIKKKGIGIRLRKGDLDRWLESDLHQADGWEANQ